MEIIGSLAFFKEYIALLQLLFECRFSLRDIDLKWFKLERTKCRTCEMALALFDGEIKLVGTCHLETTTGINISSYLRANCLINSLDGSMGTGGFLESGGSPA
jgi:hypothetical protein